MSLPLAGPFLDPNVKRSLQTHLEYVQYPEKACCLQIGRISQVTTAANISKNGMIADCFDRYKGPIAYPKLPERNYLVACIERQREAEVVAVYSLEHMQFMHAQTVSPFVNEINWCVLELSEELESVLLKK